MTGIFGDTFARGWDTGPLDDRSWVDAFLEVELALLRACAVVGAVPAAAAATIEASWARTDLDVAGIGAGAGAGGNPIIGIAAALKAAVPEDLRQYVHFGATSQDILDSAVMLLSQRALTVIVRHLSAAADAAADLAMTYLRTELPGRTLMQDALPTTFGLKAATWTAGLDGAATRMTATAATLPVQYGGPVGTFSGSHGYGPRIRREMANLLGLADADLPWHTVRLPIADLAGGLATASGVVGKVALDVVLLAQTAVGEVAEGQPKNAEGSARGGSSSMPHKHNPIAAISARACALRTPALAGTLFAAMAQEHERAAGAWHSEWETLADLLRLTGSAAAWLTESLQTLQINPDRMQQASQGMTGSTAAAVELTETALRTRARR
jgi:3-carboxy-cis,cis-muconate cycloisomerase